MFRKLHSKQKNKLLLIGVAVVLWSVYVFAIRNTIEAHHDCIILQQQIDSAADAPERLIQLKTDLQELESITGTSDTTNTLHEQLLGIISVYCHENNITLRDFASPIRYHQQEWLVETHPIIVEGSYVSLLKLVHKLEIEKTGKVVSVDFHSKRDNKTQTLSLTATIYIQNIIHEKS
jgi:hypothetical protein